MKRDLILVVPLLFCAPWAHGAVITVCSSGCNFTHVAPAVQAASPGDIIEVYPGTYAESSTVSVDKTLTIVGTYPRFTVVRNSSGSQPVFSIFLGQGERVEIRELTITDGSRGIYINSSGNYGQVLISDCIIENNSSSHAGGGVEADGELVTIEDSIVRNNTATDGGGLYSNDAPLVILRTVFEGNTASSGGGGLYSSGGATIVASHFLHNSAAQGGGAKLYGTNSIGFSRFESNLAAGGGGGLYGYADINNSVFYDNRSNSNGGGALYGGGVLENVTISQNWSFNADAAGILSQGTLRLVDCTVAFNYAETGLAANVRSEGTTYVRGSIISDSIGNNCGGLFTSEGYNLDDDGTCGLVGEGDLSGVPAHLLGLVDNGGSTLTHALRFDSPALDSGPPSDFPATDQRGVPRPQDGDGDGIAVCDMGAYEHLEGFVFADGFQLGDTSAWSTTVP